MDTVRWHLEHHHQLALSRATVHRILVRNSAVVPDPSKRPKSSYLRFEAEQPNETWQSDFTQYRHTPPDGTPGVDVEIITWLDDHSRYALHISAHTRITAPIVLATFTETAGQHGYPASTLTDNGMVYTVRFAGGRGGKTKLEVELRRLGITQKNSRPNHPTTCARSSGSNRR
ncbi:DDE-type integrase/transposase/recombinase [Nocardioides immobilis]|uniref:DDE-type integrase/transposase/recombinase n=1 Tax=Nocardioides immobilis TaxID=2049295 RepID=UPI0015F9F9C2|nr:DDE-type integrase/transposase/recombinase [Nocardioides immobilis]